MTAANKILIFRLCGCKTRVPFPKAAERLFGALFTHVLDSVRCFFREEAAAIVFITSQKPSVPADFSGCLRLIVKICKVNWNLRKERVDSVNRTNPGRNSYTGTTALPQQNAKVRNLKQIGYCKSRQVLRSPSMQYPEMGIFLSCNLVSLCPSFFPLISRFRDHALSSFVRLFVCPFVHKNLGWAKWGQFHFPWLQSMLDESQAKANQPLDSWRPLDSYDYGF